MEADKLSGCEQLQYQNLETVVLNQTALVPQTALAIQGPRAPEGCAVLDNNEEAWQLCFQEKVHHVRKVTLKGFHLFEWFPLALGLFHAPGSNESRDEAKRELMKIDGSVCYKVSAGARVTGIDTRNQGR